jgi:hypothetical protein
MSNSPITELPQSPAATAPSEREPQASLLEGGGQIIISSATLAKKKDNITDIV